MGEAGNAGAKPDPPTEEVRFCSDIEVVPPKRRTIPSKDPSFLVQPKGDAAETACPVFVSVDALKEAVRFAKTDRTREVGGMLVGGRFIDGGEEFVWIDRFFEGRHLLSLPASARFTHDTFEDVWDRIEQGGPYDYNPLILGWFHTHPGFGAFLSDRDRFIFERFFDLPFLLALVVDPVREELLFFRWREGEIRSTGFHLVHSNPA